MKHLAVIAATALAVLGTPPLLCATATHTYAQEWRDSEDGAIDRQMRDAFLDRLKIRRDLRDLLEDRRESRQHMRQALMDLIGDRLRERRSAWRDRDDDDDGGLLGRLRERRSALRDRDDDDDGSFRGRLRERLAERLRGREGGDCYFFTRVLRDEDGDFLILVRRRICRD